MKIEVIKGSARNGNTKAAVEAFVKGASKHHEVEIIAPEKLHIAPCKGCNVCQYQNGCVDKDDTNATIDKIAAADMILFTSPVYWWGITGQLKLVIDKCYCRGMQMNGKKAGLIIVGAAPVEDSQYELIRQQFACIAGHLNWDMVFEKFYSAMEKDVLKNDADAMAELEKIGAEL